MKIIFLDVGGVMNPGEGPGSSLEQALMPRHVAVLNELVKASNAQVVLSSAYRMCHSIAGLRQVFKTAGFEGKLVGKTPVKMGRDEEIQTYLDEHPDIESYVVLDDMKDMGKLTPKLVCTYPTGLKLEHVGSALKLLG